MRSPEVLLDYSIFRDILEEQHIPAQEVMKLRLPNGNNAIGCIHLSDYPANIVDGYNFLLWRRTDRSTSIRIENGLLKWMRSRSLTPDDIVIVTKPQVKQSVPKNPYFPWIHFHIITPKITNCAVEVDTTPWIIKR